MFDAQDLGNEGIEAEHYVSKREIRNDCCLKRVALANSWINVASHSAITAKQADEMTLSDREAADADNVYNDLTTNGAPVAFLASGKLCTRFRAGKEHIHLRTRPRDNSDFPGAHTEVFYRKVDSTNLTLWAPFEILSLIHI